MTDENMTVEQLKFFNLGVEHGRGLERTNIKESAIGDTRMLESTAEVFAAFHYQTMELHKLCGEFVKWKHCMSYNDRYFGEPQGHLKRIAYAIDRILLNQKSSPNTDVSESELEAQTDAADMGW